MTTLPTDATSKGRLYAAAFSALRFAASRNAISADDEKAILDALAPPSAAPVGMVPWAGGDSAPEDWDGGLVLLADGTYWQEDPEDGPIYWGRDFSETGCIEPGCVIAYTPKALQQSRSTPGAVSEVSALRNALADLTRACEFADAHEELSDHVDGSLLDAANAALELQYPVIWTEDQVAQLNAHQARGDVHPYTCGGERGDAAHVARAEEDMAHDRGILIATVRGWICPACDYRQFWAHGIENLAASPVPVDASGAGELRVLLARCERMLDGIGQRGKLLDDVRAALHAAPAAEPDHIGGVWMPGPDEAPAAGEKRDAD